MPETYNSLDELYTTELKDLYSAETQILEALPKMANAASSPKRRFALCAQHGHPSRGESPLVNRPA